MLSKYMKAKIINPKKNSQNTELGVGITSTPLLLKSRINRLSSNEGAFSVAIAPGDKPVNEIRLGSLMLSGLQISYF